MVMVHVPYVKLILLNTFNYQMHLRFTVKQFNNKRFLQVGSISYSYYANVACEKK